MHVAVALLKEGQRVGTIDLDSNQKSLTHYIKNRRVWTKHQALNSRHRSIATSGARRGRQVDKNEAEHFTSSATF